MSAPSTCVLSGILYTGAGAPLEGALVRIRINGSTYAWAGDGFAAADPQKAYTDSAGAWSITLPQGEVFLIEIPSSLLAAVGTVPSSSTASISDVSLTEYTP